MQDRAAVVRLREGIPEELRERAKTCPYLQRVVQSIEHGVSPEAVYVHALILMSQTIADQQKLIVADLARRPPPVFIVTTAENLARIKKEVPSA